MKMKTFLLAAAFLSALALTYSAQAEPTASPDCDVLVVGGGSAGTVAAVQAARAGAKTVLFEASARLGGTATSGGVNFPGLFHAWGKQVIAGIGWEWVTKTVELDGGTLPDFQKPTGSKHWEHQIKVNAPLYSLVAEELCREAGVDLRYFESPICVEPIAADSANETADAARPYRWRVRSCAIGEERLFRAKVLIDATGNGALCATAGAERLREEATQPGTYQYFVKHGIDLKTADRAEIESLYQAALADGRIQPGDAHGGIIKWLGGSGANYVYGADNSTAALRSETNQRGRAAALRMLRFAKTLPGGESARLISTADEVGVRETYRVRTAHIITQEEYVTGALADDALCYAFYPIDLHVNETGVHPKHLAKGVVATVPRGALIPCRADGGTIPNLLVAGRCIGSDRGANSALRVQATCMATGQAAGALAVVAARTGNVPERVDLDEVKKLLAEHGAVLPTK